MPVGTYYRTASNFCGVPIFVISVVDLQSRKFPPQKINAYRYMRMDEGRGQKHSGSMEARPPIQATIATVIQLMAYSKLIQYSISCCFFAEVAQ
jgi:hypothetical protein